MQHQRILNRFKSILLALGVVGSALTLTACGGDGNDPLASFKEQTLAWRSCGTEILGEPYAPIIKDIGSRIQCADMRVPLDYLAPAKGSATVALVRVAAGNGKADAPAIMFSPGGPGISDPGMPAAMAWKWGRSDTAGGAFKTIAQTYQMIGWSPRGTGLSTNLNCRSDDIEPVYVESPSDRSSANIDAMLTSAKVRAAACKSNPLTPYINTDATARDLDLMRQLLHQEQLNFYGLSYATWLGTWYATLFPERVGRFVLIGNVDATITFDRMWLNNVAALQRVLDDVLAPYAARHPKTFGFTPGTSAAEVSQIMGTLPPTLRAAATGQMDPGLHDSSQADNTVHTLRAAMALKDLLATSPTPTKESMQGLIDAAGFAAPTARAQAQALNEAYFELLNATPEPVKLAPTDSVHFAIQCNDTAMVFDEAGWVQQNNAQAARYSFLGGHFTPYPCLYWGGPVVQRPALANAARAKSMLLLQAQFDPQTPFEGAMISWATLPNTRMILVDNAIDHVVPVPYGNDCVDLPVAQYLLNGTQPPRMTSCPGKPLPQDATNTP